MANLAAENTPDGSPIGLTSYPAPGDLVLLASEAVQDTSPTAAGTGSDTPRHRAVVDTYAGPRYLTAARRRWLYGILLAVVPLLVVYGILDETQAVAWVGVAAAVLGLGLAVSRTEDTPRADQ
ncbi:phage holin [Kocuria sp.]|uniref:phage holin n=1 Tax=Kocuria sp. TaxID=1871328 RepID=UPI0026DFA077|nr:hypothetical protein [Kocuria sp.]MDO5618014.1 hypothetical protein [Kocuria sp.]